MPLAPSPTDVFNLTNIAAGGQPIVDLTKYTNASGMADGLVGGHLPIVVFYFPVVPGSPYLPPDAAAAGGSRYWTMIAAPTPDMQGSREQGVLFRFLQLQCKGPAMAAPCSPVGVPQCKRQHALSDLATSSGISTRSLVTPSGSAVRWGQLVHTHTHTHSVCLSVCLIPLFLSPPLLRLISAVLRRLRHVLVVACPGRQH